jgi:hypothetical protein
VPGAVWLLATLTASGELGGSEVVTSSANPEVLPLGSVAVAEMYRPTSDETLNVTVKVAVPLLRQQGTLVTSGRGLSTKAPGVGSCFLLSLLEESFERPYFLAQSWIFPIIS